MTTTSAAPDQADGETPCRVAVVTLGCARNEVDSEELAGRLEAGGFQLVADARRRRHRRGQHLRLRRGRQEGLGRHPARWPPTSSRPAAQAVVAVGCLAERYGKDLAESLPEADAVLGFDDYPDIAARLRSIVAGEVHHPHTPAGPPPAAADLPGRPRRLRDRVPGHADQSTAATHEIGQARRPRVRASYAAASTAGRWRRSSWPAAATAAAPSARSRASAARSSAGARATCCRRRAGWREQGVKRALPRQRELHVLRQGPRRPAAARDAAARAGRHRGHRPGPRVLPPARRDPARPDRGDRRRPRASRPTSTSPSSTPSATVLRRMRRFGDPESFLGLLDQIRALAPAGRRPVQRDRRLPRRDRGRPARRCATSSSAARIDVTGVFGYSDEDGTEAAAYDGKLDEDEVRARTEHVTGLVEELDRAARGGAHRRDGQRARRVASRTASSRAAPRTRDPRSTAPPPARRIADARVGEPRHRGGDRHRRRRPLRA